MNLDQGGDRAPPVSCCISVAPPHTHIPKNTHLCAINTNTNFQSANQAPP